MSYTNSLSFTNDGDISFSLLSDRIEVFVGTTLLGTINHQYPVTIYQTVVSGSRTLFLEEITSQQYNDNNSGQATRTRYFNNTNSAATLRAASCPTDNTILKSVGWDDDLNLECVKGGTGHFDMSAKFNFKVMMEVITIQGQSVVRMVVRYSTDVVAACSSSQPLCSTGLYCYVCD